MNAVTQFLSDIGLWPKPRMPESAARHIAKTLRTAADDANQLADNLEKIADDADPFGEFARRARHSRFRG